MATIARANGKTEFSLATILAPFRALGRALVALAEASPRMRELERLNNLSDRDLAARGLTREGEIRRILGIAAAL